MATNKKTGGRKSAAKRATADKATTKRSRSKAAQVASADDAGSTPVVAVYVDDPGPDVEVVVDNVANEVDDAGSTTEVIVEDVVDDVADDDQTYTTQTPVYGEGDEQVGQESAATILAHVRGLGSQIGGLQDIALLMLAELQAMRADLRRDVAIVIDTETPTNSQTSTGEPQYADGSTGTGSSSGDDSADLLELVLGVEDEVASGAIPSITQEYFAAAVLNLLDNWTPSDDITDARRLIASHGTIVKIWDKLPGDDEPAAMKSARA